MKQALIKGIRTAAQTFAALLVALPTASSLLDIQRIAEPLLVAVYASAIAGLVAFLQNLAEHQTLTAVGNLPAETPAQLTNPVEPSALKSWIDVETERKLPPRIAKKIKELDAQKPSKKVRVKVK